MPLRFALGLILSELIGWLGYRRGVLSQSGVLGAAVVGTLILGWGGWALGLLLFAFFVSSSLAAWLG
jgi:uncharacterized membrane protein